MNISRHGKGWRVIVQVGTVRKSKVCKTMAAARAAGSALTIELGATPDPTGATVGDLLMAHIAKNKDWSHTTMADRVSLVGTPDRPGRIPAWMMAWRVQTVTVQMVEEGLDRLIDDEILSKHRVHRLHGLMVGAFDRAARWGWITTNPVRSVKAPKVGRANITVPAPAAVDALVSYIRGVNPELGAAIHLVARTGIRRGELCGLRWSDLRELADGRWELSVERAVSSTTGNGRHTKDVKTGPAGGRAIELGATTLRSLRAHRAAQLEWAMAQPGMSAPEWMFTVDGVNPWRADYVTTALRRIVGDDADYPTRYVGPRIGIHQLRHFAATQWIAARIDIVTVAYLLGHAKSSTTTDIYAAFIPGKGAEAADVMERILSNG